MLNKDEIQARAIIVGAHDTSYRAASYDVRVQTITAVEPSAKVRLLESEFYTVPPQGMVEVMSEEIVRVPDDVAGYASVKTDLSRRGLLALNTGIIDPGYDGPVSAVMVNFGKTAFSLHRGDVFLRLTFHEYKTPAQFQAPPTIPREEFVRGRKKEVAERFSSDFLDIGGHIDEIARGALWRSLRLVLILVPLIAILVTFVTWGVTIGVAHWQGGFLSRDQVRAAVDEYFRSEEFRSVKAGLTEARSRELQEEIRATVDKELESRLPKASAPAKLPK